MSRREDIDNSIWHDPDFERLSLEAQHLYLWSFTNPRCGMAGIYKVSRRAMTESNLTPEQITDALEELAQSSFVFYDEDVLFVRTRVKHLRTKTEQIAKSIAADLAKLQGDHPLLRVFLSEYEGDTWLEPHLTLDGGSEISPKQAEKRDSVEGHPTLQGKGSGKGKGNNSGKGSSQEFDEWLGHYRETTKRPEVRGSAPARDAFRARRREGMSLDDLKLATVGCHSDEFCREHGHDVPDTILRASKVTRYVELGRKVSPRRPKGPKRTREQEIARLEGMGVSRVEAEEAVA